MALVLVTGGSGFIGHHLVESLRARGQRVRVLDVRPPAAANADVEYFHGSVLDGAGVDTALAGVDQVYHLAGLPGMWVANKQDFHDVNFRGTEIVLAVDLGSDLVGRYAREDDRAPTQTAPRGFMSRFLPRYNRDNRASEPQAEPESMPPSLLETLMGSINIMQLRIARSRLAGEPPDALLTPRLGHLGLLDYHRAEFAIAEGRETVTRMLPAIRNAIPA